MIKFYLFNKQIILNAILFIALTLALVMRDESGLKDFFLGVATSIAFVNFINGFGKGNAEQQKLYNND
jgi:hypothetical protein